MPLKNFESQGRGTRGKRGTSDTSSSGDEVLHCITCNDHDTLLMITQNGLAYGIPAYQVPTGSRTSKGSPITSVLPISLDQTVTSVLPVTEFSKDEFIILATTQGWIKKTALDAFAKTTSRGLIIATLEEGDKLQWCHRCTDSDDILLGSSCGFAARFRASSLRASGRTTRGVRSMKLKDGDTIVDVDIVSGGTKVNGDAGEEEFVLCVTEQGYGKRVSTSEFRVTSRPSGGVIALKFKKRLDDQDRLASFCIVKEDDEILLNTAKGIMVRQKAGQVPSQSRAATGAVLQKVDGLDKITSVSVVPIPEEEEMF
jgi:DNA gyrase subunit A